jgi:glycerol-3-phosphate cytidylyltransferase
MKIVLTYGTFDLFHHGHLNILRRAKLLGDQLFVGLSSDRFNAIKGKKSHQTYEERYEALIACRYVDHVFTEDNWQQKILDVKRFNASCFVMGDDWTGKFDDLLPYCNVTYLSRTPGISSTALRNEIQSAASVDL